MFNELRELSQFLIQSKLESYRRYFMQRISPKHRFYIILGERGIGKTTTLIQTLVDFADHNPFSDKILYVQADHFLVGKQSLYEIAEEFVRLGGKFIAFDEIHKYSNWSLELKSIYDTFPGLRILASGSSALEIHKGSHDLSRRALVYRMVGLSFREFIELKYHLSFQTFDMNAIISEHPKLASQVIDQLSKHDLKIIKLFNEYLEYGYYPYFRIFADIREYKATLEQNLHVTLESDLVVIYPHLSGNSIKKIKQLLIFLAQAVPFTPNWQSIKKITDIGDDRTIKTYFKYLEDAAIIHTLGSGSSKIDKLGTTEKVYLGNPNQLYAYTSQPNMGTIRETFFISIVQPVHEIALASNTDFVVDNRFYFEIGGKNKSQKQIVAQAKGYLAIDNIEQGVDRRIPLWLFGFLY